MISAGKISIISVIIFLTTTLLYASLNSPAEDFDESSWEKAISSLDRSLFYAPHEKEGSYYNPWMPMPEKSIFTMLKWRFSEKPDFAEDEKNFLPSVNMLTAEFINSNDNFITWIGHASLLLKSSGKVIIIDPVFGEVTFLKKRRAPSALTFEEASKIKGEIIVLLTHNHYDHFDKSSIECLPSTAKFIVPKGLASDIADLQKSDIREADWWDDIKINKLTITFLPSQHWSKRGLFDTNKSLWGSYLIDTGKKKIYICGDSGYSKIYSEIAMRYHDIDYAFMSTGASQPRWFMHYVHQNETEAVRGFKELGAKKMIPIHWGSFSLGDEPAGYQAIHLKNRIPGVTIMNGGGIINL